MSIVGMNDFSISCKYLENIRSAINELPEYRDRIFTVVINETFKIELPLIVASSFSSSIAKAIKNDPTMNKFHVSLNPYMYNTDDILDSLNNIKAILCGGSKVTLNEENKDKYKEDICTFAAFGVAIGNEDLINPLRAKMSTQVSEINENNVVDILQSKQIFQFAIDEMKEEMMFISTHFDIMSTREDFINFSPETTNEVIVESIISSDQLQMKNEDTLLAFLIAINKQRTFNNISV